MRLFALNARDASLTSPCAPFAPGGGLDGMQQDPVGRDLLERSSAPQAEKPPSGSAGPSEPVWNFVPPSTDAAPPKLSENDDPELERYLVEEIARAKRRRPLMGRLAQVERAYGEVPGDLLGTSAPPQPPPLPPLSALESVMAPGPDLSMPTDGSQIDQLMEEFGEEPPPFASAQWLGNARRERRRTLVRTVFAWIATLAIGAAIVAIALPLQG